MSNPGGSRKGGWELRKGTKKGHGFCKGEHLGMLERESSFSFTTLWRVHGDGPSGG